VNGLNNRAVQVLQEIFSGTLDLDDLVADRNALFPNYEDVNALAEVLASNASEEEYQRALEAHPSLVLGAFGHGQSSDLAFLSKPKISSLFVADFAVLSYDQGGCKVCLLEIERATARVFNQAGRPARDLQYAMGQVRDWDRWISSSRRSFVKELVLHASRLPVYPETAANGSFLTVAPEALETTWRDFDGYDNPVIEYAVLIGRWSKLTQDERDRLRHMNQRDATLCRIWTYDQLVRRAVMRPAIRFY